MWNLGRGYVIEKKKFIIYILDKLMLVAEGRSQSADLSLTDFTENRVGYDGHRLIFFSLIL